MISSCLSKDFFSALDIPSCLGAHEMQERNLGPAAVISRPQSPEAEERDPRLNISVIFTAVEPTLFALKEAGALADNLGASISLVVPHVVPYPLPLHHSRVMAVFNERKFRVIAGQSRVETSVILYLCRDRMATLKVVLKPHSLVIVGGRKRWWPTKEQRLARELRRAGHEVIFSEVE